MRSKALVIKLFVVLGVASLVFLVGCGGGASQPFHNQPPPPTGSNPAPSITTLSPNTSVAGGAAFTLTITGTNFVAASMVTFGGAAPTTTFVNSTQLTAAIPAAAIASVGMVAVTVTNPAPGGGTSNAMSFTTSGGNLVPTIDSLSPSCSPKDEQVLNPFANGQLLVNGQNFVASSVVRWNGNDRPTSFVSSSQLTAQISASDIGTIETAAVTVFNPAPGGGSSNISTFTIDAGGAAPQSIVVDHSGKFAYVANLGCESVFGNVSMYTIDPNTGVLTSIGPPMIPDDEGARSVAVDPSGKFAYVANWGEGDTAGSISTYTVNGTTGALTSAGTIFAGCPGLGCGLLGPWSVVVHPSGKFVYVANEAGFSPTTVAMFTIDGTTGALTSIGTVTAGGRAFAVAVDSAGKFAYVATESGPPDVVSMYTINGTTGALTSIGTIAAGTDINGGTVHTSVAADPAGNFVYATNPGSNDLSMYSIDTTTGTLMSLGPIIAGTGPASVAVDPTGKFAYVANSGSNDVSMYTINAATGVLSSIGAIAAGLSPSSIAIHPSGKFAYVTNSGSNNVSMYIIDAATGALVLMGTTGM
jgi:YVTN family beta-propeller protein